MNSKMYCFKLYTQLTLYFETFVCLIRTRVCIGLIAISLLFINKFEDIEKCVGHNTNFFNKNHTLITIMVLYSFGIVLRTS